MSEINDFLHYIGVYDKDTGLIEFSGPGIENGSAEIPLYSQLPDWKHITVENTVESITGTSSQLVAVTSVHTGALTTSSVAAKKGDGSTAFAGAANTAATSEIIAVSREGASSAVSNIGSKLGFKLTNTSVTALSGKVSVLVTR